MYLLAQRTNVVFWSTRFLAEKDSRRRRSSRPQPSRDSAADVCHRTLQGALSGDNRCVREPPGHHAVLHLSERTKTTTTPGLNGRQYTLRMWQFTSWHYLRHKNTFRNWLWSTMWTGIIQQLDTAHLFVPKYTHSHSWWTTRREESGGKDEVSGLATVWPCVVTVLRANTSDTVSRLRFQIYVTILCQEWSHILEFFQPPSHQN